MKKLLYSVLAALMMLGAMTGFVHAAPVLTLTGITNNQYGINVPIVATLTVDGVPQENFELYYATHGPDPLKTKYRADEEDNEGIYRIVANGTTAEFFLTYAEVSYFKVRAYPAGSSTSSNLISYSTTITGLQVEEPEFNPAPQGYSIVEVDYGTPIKIIDHAGGAEIFYSIDGETEPRQSEWAKHNPNVFKYDDNEGIKITSDRSIFAIAYKEVNGQLAGSVRIRGRFNVTKPRIRLAFSPSTYTIGTEVPKVNVTVPEGFTLGEAAGNMAIELTCPTNGFYQLITQNGVDLDVHKADNADMEDDWVIYARLVKGDDPTADFPENVELMPSVLNLPIFKNGERPAVPVFSVPSGKVYSGTQVAITCATPGATIYYTSGDGDISTLYKGPISIYSDIAFRAMAEKDGISSYNDGIAMAAYTVVEEPLPSLEVTVNPEAGSVITEAGTKITVTTNITVDKIYFKLYAKAADVDKDANFNTTATEYSETVKPVPTEETPIVRLGLVKDGTWKYYSYLYAFPKDPVVTPPVGPDPIDPDPEKPDTVAAPIFSKASGEVKKGSEIALSCLTPGAEIHYTIDGEEPTATSTLYTTPLIIDTVTTIKAIATKEGWINSTVATATYTLKVTPVAPADPDIVLVFSPASGSTVDVNTNVSIGAGRAGTPIFYKMYSSLKEAQEAEWDQDQADLYQDEMPPVLDMAHTTIKATYAIDDEHIADTFFYATYTIREVYAINLTFLPASGSVVEDSTEIQVTATTDVGQIWFKVYADSMASVEGADMFIQESDVIGVDGNPMITQGNTFLKCGAFDKTVGRTVYFYASYKIKGEVADTVAEPTFSLASGEVAKGTKVALACATEGARIYYTVNGLEPTASSTLYEDSIVIDGNMTIRAIAMKEDMENSKMAVASYTVVSVANENKALAGVSIYPNPNDGQFHISVPVDASVEVFTANGQVVKRAALAAGANTLRVDNSGIYFVRVRANGQVAIQKVVVR